VEPAQSAAHRRFLSYHKFPGEDWAADEFVGSQVTLVNGQTATMLLAERGTPLSNGLWVREIRRLNPNGHQTAIITTDYGCDFRRLAANMMARWSQENFFKYAAYSVDYGRGSKSTVCG
jgi:hypothetical protein